MKWHEPTHVATKFPSHCRHAVLIETYVFELSRFEETRYLEGIYTISCSFSWELTMISVVTYNYLFFWWWCNLSLFDYRYIVNSDYWGYQKTVRYRVHNWKKLAVPWKKLTVLVYSWWCNIILIWLMIENTIILSINAPFLLCADLEFARRDEHRYLLFLFFFSLFYNQRQFDLLA